MKILSVFLACSMAVSSLPTCLFAADPPGRTPPGALDRATGRHISRYVGPLRALDRKFSVIEAKFMELNDEASSQIGIHFREFPIANDNARIAPARIRDPVEEPTPSHDDIGAQLPHEGPRVAPDAGEFLGEGDEVLPHAIHVV